MSRSKWIAAAALVAVAGPAAEAGDRTRVQIAIAPYWGWGGPLYRPPPFNHRYYGHAYGGGYGGYSGGYYQGGPVIRFEYRDNDRYYRPGGYRPGGYLRYDSRRDRDYYRSDRDRHDRGHRGRDWRD